MTEGLSCQTLHKSGDEGKVACTLVPELKLVQLHTSCNLFVDFYLVCIFTLCLSDSFVSFSLKGVVVKADYIPLLQSLAPYGWRLMCVLPTPIVKTNRYRYTTENTATLNSHLC